jgi:hypothetical protein
MECAINVFPLDARTARTLFCLLARPHFAFVRFDNVQTGIAGCALLVAYWWSIARAIERNRRAGLLWSIGGL